jgi:hypothetical protein
MRRTIIFAGGVSFLMAFLGTVLALALVLPAIVDAQEARIRAEQVTVVGNNGADRLQLGAGPGANAGLLIRDVNGTQRVTLNTGRNRAADSPDDAGLSIWSPDGTTTAVRVGMGHGPTGGQPLGRNVTVFDSADRARISLNVAEDDTPAIRIRDANGNVIWQAP